MDPDATLQLLNESLTSGEPLEIITQHRDNLLAWIRTGGFHPHWSDFPIATEHVRQYLKQILRLSKSPFIISTFNQLSRNPFDE